MRVFPASVICLIALICLVAAGLKKSDEPGKRLRLFADSFLDSLDDEKKKVAVMAYDNTDTRVDWHFIPKKTRKGLVLSEMNRAQRVSALRLVRASLSDAGYDKAKQIMLLEGVLRELEGEGRNWARDPHKYYVTIFGQPSDKDPWALSFEGHHLSLNFSFRDGKVVDSTPQFFAANPATVINDVSNRSVGKGTRVLKDEEQLAFDLINSLKEEQRNSATIDEKAPKEIRFAGEAQVKVGEPEGIAYKILREDDKKLLQKLVNCYIDAVPEKLANQRRKQIEDDGWGDVHFAWAGATKPGIGHYYRIRGKRFLIEFVNTQPDPAGNPANHIHCVWRDVSGDFDLENE